MFKFVLILAVAAVAVAKPSHLSIHSIVEPVVVGATIHSAPSAISHQSHTQFHSKTIVTPVVAPIVKTYVAAPIVHAAPVVSHVLPVLKTVHSAPIVHTAPLVHSVHSSISYGLHQ